MSAAGPAAREALFEEEALGKAYDTRLLRRLWPFVRPYRGQIALSILFVVPLLALDVAPAWLIKLALDEVIVPAASGRPAPGAFGAFLLTAPGGLSPLLWLGLVYPALSAASSAPHSRQNRLVGPFSAPQFGHACW